MKIVIKDTQKASKFSTIIQHLRELKRAGIIQGRIFGAQCKYGLNMEILQEFHKLWSDSMTRIIKASTND